MLTKKKLFKPLLPSSSLAKLSGFTATWCHKGKEAEACGWQMSQTIISAMAAKALQTGCLTIRGAPSHRIAKDAIISFANKLKAQLWN